MPCPYEIWFIRRYLQPFGVLCKTLNDYDDYFVHTFSDLHSNLSNPIVFGELEISLRATNSSMSKNVTSLNL